MNFIKSIFTKEIPNVDVDNIYNSKSFITVNNSKKGERYNLTYGEITEDGVKNIIKYMNKNNYDLTTFIDLGSGNGRSLVYAVKNGYKEGKGVEIVEERHDFAVTAKHKLPKYFQERMELSLCDLFNLDEDFFPKKCTIFISNLLFPRQLQQDIFEFLSNITKSGTILIVSRRPDNIFNFKLLEVIKVPMSWESDSECSVFIKE
jgi:SAM-dependent methyltransferase